MAYLLRLLVGILGATVFILLLSAFARLQDQPICLTVKGNEDLYILDVSRGLLEQDTRYSRPEVMPYFEQEYALFAYPDPEDSGRVRLVLENRADGEKIELEESVYSPAPGSWGSRTAWSHDQFAYLWQDANQQEHVTIFNVADRSKRTAPLPQFDPVNDDIWMAGWSADGNYLTFHEQDMQNGAAVHIWSIETMQPLALDPELPKLLHGAWSPQGDVYAAITQQENNERFLLIISPENAESVVRVSIPADIAPSILWSPDGERLALARKRLVTRDNVWFEEWFFEIFRSDGTLIQEDIVGKYVPQPAPGDPSSVLGNYIPGFWSLDGEQWIFLQDHGDLTDLMALDTTSGNIETIETNLVSNLAMQMFFPTLNYAWAFQQDGAAPDNRQLVLPLWRDEALTLEYVNFERDQRFTLLEGAREILDSAFVSYFPALAQWDDNHLVVTWADASGEAHLRVVHSADGAIVADLDEMEEVSHVQWLERDWLGFTSRRSGEYHLELVNMQTGEHRQLLTESYEGNPWIGFLSPDQRQLAIFVSDVEQLLAIFSGRIFIVALESGHVNAVGEHGLPYLVWSPDSSMLAYLYAEELTAPGIYVVNTDGEIIQQARLPRPLSAQSVISQWNRCEADPPRNF